MEEACNLIGARNISEFARVAIQQYANHQGTQEMSSDLQQCLEEMAARIRKVQVSVKRMATRQCRCCTDGPEGSQARKEE